MARISLVVTDVMIAGIYSMLGVFHCMLGKTWDTPGGGLTLHVSEYEVPATPDPSPDTLTITGETTTT